MGTLARSLVVLLIIAIASPAAAAPGVVAGSVKDAAGQPLAAARLRLQTAAGRVVATTTASEGGRFRFGDVPPGTYSVVGENDGFEVVTGVATVTTSEGATVDLVAAPRSVRNPNDSTNPAYQQLDLGITHRFELPGFGKMEARFDVINVLGQDYVLRDGTGGGIFAKQFGPPRGFFAGLTKEF